jgi:hypothetical protein
MNVRTIDIAPRVGRRVFIAALVLVALALAFLSNTVPVSAGRGGGTGAASVRLVRLLSDIPESMRGGTERLYDLRVRLLEGNVLVFRKGGDFAALLPIERLSGAPDSLRYFYYVEKAGFLWVFAGARTKGILTVPDGGPLQFDSFRLRWGRADDGLGWIYFPDEPVNDKMRFSVVSGQSVDLVDPKDTKYWVELGSDVKAGF